MRHTTLYIVLLCLWSLHVQGQEAQCLEKAPDCPTACKLDCERYGKNPQDVRICNIGLSLCMDTYKTIINVTSNCVLGCMALCHDSRQPYPDEISKCYKTNCTQEMNLACSIACPDSRAVNATELEACKQALNADNAKAIEKNAATCIQKNCIDAPLTQCKIKVPATRVPTAEENQAWDANCEATNGSKYYNNVAYCKSSKPTFKVVLGAEKQNWIQNCVSSFDQQTCNATCRANTTGLSETDFKTRTVLCESKRLQFTSEEVKSCKENCAASYNYTTCYNTCQSRPIFDEPNRLACREECLKKDIANYARVCNRFTEIAVNFTKGKNPIAEE